MSDFKFPCPKCGQNILCDTSNAGMQIPCPVCKAVLTVPPPPPPPPAANSPGKLSINKTAYHPPPPPAASSAPGGPPKPTSWGGSKPAAVAARKAGKPKWVKISIWCVILLIAIGGGLFGYMKYAEKKHQEEVAKQEEEARQKAEADRQAKEAAAKAKAERAVYSLDLTETEFPVRKASGKIHGSDFKPETVTFHGGALTLRQTNSFPGQFMITLPAMEGGKSYANQTFNVNATNLVNNPKVILYWRSDNPKAPGVASYTKGYAMKLQFGDMADGQVTGKIFLCVPDVEQSFVAGDFAVGSAKLGTTAPGAPPAAKRGRRRDQPPGTPGT